MNGKPTPCPACAAVAAERDAAVATYKGIAEAAEASATAAEQARQRLWENWQALFCKLAAAERREAELRKLAHLWGEESHKLHASEARSAVRICADQIHAALASPSLPATPAPGGAPSPAALYCAQCLFGEDVSVALVDGECPRCVIEGDTRRLRKPSPSPAPSAAEEPDAMTFQVRSTFGVQFGDGTTEGTAAAAKTLGRIDDIAPTQEHQP